jgi:Fe-S cluster assembly scaffold protein SufB
MEEIDKKLLKKISGINVKIGGAYNIRKNGKALIRNTTKNIDIVTKKDASGIDIFVKENTKKETLHIPVIITKSGLTDLVYNDFYIGKNAEVEIIAGCGIHNDNENDSIHNGIHRFFLEEGAKVKYIENHYGQGDGNGKKILNPVTEITLKKDSSLEMNTVQIKGVDSTIRKTKNDSWRANSKDYF